MRRATAVVVAAGLLAITLTGCSTDPSANCDKALSSGSASSLISATGPFGSKPTVSFPTPVVTDKSERSILIDGSGDQVHKGQLIEIQYTLLDGQSGDVTGASSYSKSQPYLVSIGGNSPAIDNGLQCVPVGSRVAIAMSPKDAGGGSATTAGVAVIDVLHAYLARADGAVRPSVSGFPTVVLAPNGQPGITIPSGSAPKSVRTETLKEGDGATVKNDSSVILHYTAVGWDQKNIVYSTWKAGAPDLVSMADGQSSANQVLPQAMLKQLVGKKVGSQVVVETPASGQVPASAWVVDILGVR